MKASWLVVILAALATAACSAHSTTPSPILAPALPGLSRVEISFEVTSNRGLARTWQYRAIATARFSDGSTEDVTAKAVWTSSNPSVAVVSTAGNVLVESPGRADLRATYRGVTGVVIFCVEAGPEAGCQEMG